jgi:hypothetical protein
MVVDPLYIAALIGVLFISAGLMKSRMPMMILLLGIAVASLLEVRGGFGHPMGGLALMAKKQMAGAFANLGHAFWKP